MSAKQTILVTGGAGFIGSNFIRQAFRLRPHWRIVNFDALTYAGNAANLADEAKQFAQRYRFIQGDICDSAMLSNLLEEEKPDGVFHFAAESHVDRSITGPLAFVETNVGGTCQLLTACHQLWEKSGRPDQFRFLHVSTDEVYGSLGPVGSFSESTPYDPSSPYSASKAASDHFVRAWHRTYGFPILITNCSNNFGPYQFPEKLIPLIIQNIIEEKSLPVYGDGSNVRDWLYVLDHCEALIHVFENATVGETYNIGGGSEYQNIEIVKQICSLIDQRLDRNGDRNSTRLIQYVEDRPGHDLRYAIDAGKIQRDLGWKPRFTFEQALADTVDWYLSNQAWMDDVRSGEYRNWINKQYEHRKEC